MHKGHGLKTSILTLALALLLAVPALAQETAAQTPETTPGLTAGVLLIGLGAIAVVIAMALIHMVGDNEDEKH